MSSSQSSQMFSVYVPTAAAPVTMFTPTPLDPTSSSSLPSASSASSSIPSDAHSPILSQTTMMLTAMPTMIPKPGLGLRLRNSPYPSHPGVYVKMPDWNVPLKAWLTFSAMIDAMNPENEDDKIKVERSVEKEGSQSVDETNTNKNTNTATHTIPPIPSELTNIYAYQNSHIADFFNPFNHHLSLLLPPQSVGSQFRLTSITSTTKSRFPFKFPFNTVYLTGVNAKKKLGDYMKSKDFNYPIILTFEVFSPDLITKLTGSDGKRQRKVVDKFQSVKNVDAFNVYVHDVYNGEEEGGGGKEGENEVIDLSIGEGEGIDLTNPPPSSPNSSSVVPGVEPDPNNRIWDKTLVSFPASPQPRPSSSSLPKPCSNIYGVKIGSYVRRHLPPVSSHCCTPSNYFPSKIPTLPPPQLHRTYVLDLGWGVAYVPDVGDRINLDVNNIRGEAVCRIENEVQRKGKRRKTQISVKEADRCRVNLKGCYLNDTVVNFYGRYISSSNPDTTSSENVYVFPTYFYTKIEGVKGSEQALADLWSDIGFWIPTNLWTLKFVIFPVNYGLHWSTACIVNPGAVFAEDGSLGQPAIIHLDSGKKLKAHSSGEIYKVIRLFLASALIAMNKEEEQELDAENGDIEKNKEVGEKRKGFVKLTSKNAKKHFTAEKLPGISPANEGKGMPQQSNEDDCGVYLLKSIKALKELADGGFELEKRHVEEKFFKVGEWAQKDIDDFREEVGSIFYDVGVEGRREESLKRQKS